MYLRDNSTLSFFSGKGMSRLKLHTYFDVYRLFLMKSGIRHLYHIIKLKR